MFVSEWKKLYKDRFVILLLAVFLLAGVGLTFAKAVSDTVVDVDACREVFDLFENDPELFAANKEALLDRFTDWNSPAAEQLVLYTLAEQQAEYPAQYRQKLAVIINNATRTLREYDAIRMKEHSYLYVMQENYRSLYTSLSDADIRYEYVRGWDLYFSYDFLTLLLAVFLVAALPRYFCLDRECKMVPVARSARNGRGRSACAKLGVSLLFTCGATVLFSFLPLASIMCVTGFSSLSNSAHVLSAFVFLPFDWTVGELLLASFGLRLAAMLCLASVLYFLCALMRSYYGAVSVGVALIAIDLLFGKTGGLFYLALPQRSLKVYETVNVFTRCVPNLYLVMGFVLLAAAVLLASGIPLYLRRGETYLYTKKAFALPFLNEPRTLFGQELKKLFLKRGALAVLLIAVLARYGISTWQYKTEFEPAEYFYSNYMETLQGELTKEKEQFLTEETARQKQFFSMTEEDIMAYPEAQRESVRQNVMASGARLDALERIERQMNYVCETQGAYLLADTGWKALFAKDFDFVFYLAFLLIAAGVVAGECDLHAEPVLRASRYGRHALYRAKTAALLFFFALLYIGCTVCDSFCFFANYELACADYPAQSVSTLSFINGIDLGSFCILAAVGSFLTALFFVFACIGVSARIGRTYAVLAVLMSAVFVPFLACKLGFDEIGFAALSQLASFGQYPALLGNTVLWGVGLFLWACLSVCLYFAGRNRLCKTGRFFSKNA